MAHGARGSDLGGTRPLLNLGVSGAGQLRLLVWFLRIPVNMLPHDDVDDDDDGLLSMCTSDSACLPKWIG